MVKMQNAVEQGGTKLDAVLKKTGMTLRELELMSANDSMGFKELSQSIGMTSTEVKQLITAGTNLEDFASVSGMTAEEFKKAWKDDAAGALSAFIKGLGNAQDKGESAITMLSEMGLTEVRLRDSLLRAANAGNLFNDAIETGTKAWQENTALANEANKRYATTESQLKITRNKIKDIATSLGDKLLPTVNKLLEKVEKGIEKFDKLNDSEKENIIKIGLMVAAAGPLLKIGGTAITTIGKVTKGIGIFTEAIGLAKNGIGDATGESAKLAEMFQKLTSPAGIAAAGITTAVAIIVTEIKKAEKETREKFSTMGQAASDFYTGLQSAEGYLENFNTTLFASAEEQENLKNQMDEVQKGITEICKTASDERRGYTQEEITQLDEYFQKLRELKNREIEIQQQIASAITQQAVTNAENFQGSLEEYKVQSQEWIATAQKQADAAIKLIQDGSIEEIALLNQKYGDEATMQNEAYATEYNNVIAQKQAKIEEANKEVAEISKVYADGYYKRSEDTKNFAERIKSIDAETEILRKNHFETMQYYEKTFGKNSKEYKEMALIEETTYNSRMKKIYDKAYENMSNWEAEQVGSWIAQLADTELYGTKLDEETKKTVEAILNSYEFMPEETKKTMNETMNGMLEGMKDKEPILWAKASNIADGILSRLRKSFDIHSPSRETRDIFQNVMKGAELGLEDEQKKLNKQVDDITSKMKTSFSNITPNIGALKQSIIDQTKTVFTTPTLNIYAQDELTPAKINTIIDTVNRRLGSKY